MKELTDKQQAVLDFINLYIMKNGYSPSMVEIQEGLGYKSITSIVKHLELIEKKGKIKRLNKASRSIVIVKEINCLEHVSFNEFEKNLIEEFRNTVKTHEPLCINLNDEKAVLISKGGFDALVAAMASNEDIIKALDESK